ncbi:MAG: glycosyltransferase [Desulfobacter sp.]
MALHELFFLSLLILSGLAVFSVFFGYPLFLVLVAPFVRAGEGKEARGFQEAVSSVSILVIFRNPGTMVQEKIDNFLALDYPKEKLELVLVSDGSDDASTGIAESARSGQIKFHHFKEHVGKTNCINTGISLCQGDIVLFSDVDAVIEPDVVERLCKHFRDPDVGGVCGQRVVGEKISGIASGQMAFIRWDSVIKRLEDRAGLSLTAHDGKLYAIRKALFRTVPQGVTDDAYISLSVTGQGSRFAFDPRAFAFIKMPSRNTGHELSRRRRIVSTSLRGLWLNRRLFNPFKYGLFSMGLFVNKVVRRLIPFCLMGIFLASFGLASSGSIVFTLFLACQAAGYLLFLLYPGVIRRLDSRNPWVRRVRKIIGIGYFFCVGMGGTVLGVISFLSGEEITKWDPVKK